MSLWDWAFDGDTYSGERDGGRLFAQLVRVRLILSDGEWHTLPELSATTGDPEASVSARIRDLRKRKWGSRIVLREYAGHGLWRYRLVP